MTKRCDIVIAAVAFLVFILSLAAAFVGPGRIGRLPQSPPAVVLEKPEVTLVLDFGGGDIATVSTAARTPFEALTLVAQIQGIQVMTKQYDFGVLVESIRDLPNTAKKAWIYFVNEESGTVAADRYELKEGDRVEWRYIEPK